MNGVDPLASAKEAIDNRPQSKNPPKNSTSIRHSLLPNANHPIIRTHPSGPYLKAGIQGTRLMARRVTTTKTNHDDPDPEMTVVLSPLRLSSPKVEHKLASMR